MLHSPKATVTRWLADGTEVTDVKLRDWRKTPATMWEQALLDAAADGTYTTSAAVAAVLARGCSVECRDKARAGLRITRPCVLTLLPCAQGGLTPLALASRAGHVNVVAALLHASANAAATDDVRALYVLLLNLLAAADPRRNLRRRS